MSERFALGHFGRASALPLFFLLLSAACMTATCDDWPDCKFQCRAGDVTLESAYLGDADGNPLQPCIAGSHVDAYLWINIYNNANSDRYAVILLTDIYIDGALQHTTYDDGLCVVNSVPPKTASSYRIYHFGWTCGQEVKLARMILSWETQSGTTCESANRKCSNRNTKCYGGSTIEVIANKPLSLNFTSNSPQCCCSISFKQSTSGGAPPYTYTWDFGDGQVSTDSDPAHVYSKPGAYTVSLTVTDSKGESATVTNQATLYQSPNAGFSTRSPVCDGDETAFADETNGGLGPYTYSWSFGDGSSSTDQSPKHAYPGPGRYNVSLTVTDSNGCSNSAAESVLVSQRPEADAGQDRSVAKGESVQVGASPTASGGLPPYTYAWSPEDGLSDASTANPTASPKATTEYTVEVLDSSGCISADRVTVYVSGIALTKEPSTTSAATGDEITYSYTVKNTGDLNVSGIALIDDKLGAITGLNRTSLEPGETALATAHYVVKSSDLPGPLVNNATASGADRLGTALFSRDDSSVRLYGILQPTVSCVKDNGNGTYTAFFGYINVGKESMSIPPGLENGFSPDPIDRGQPENFLPGEHQYAFSAQFDGSEIAWNLAGLSAAASGNSDTCIRPLCLIDGPDSICHDASEQFTSNGEETGPYTYTYSWKMDGNHIGENRSIKIAGSNYPLGDHILELEIRLSYQGSSIDASSCNALVKIIQRPSATINLIGVV